MNIVTKLLQGIGVGKLSAPIPAIHTMKQRCIILSLGQGYKLQIPVHSEEEAATIIHEFYAMNPEFKFPVEEHHAAWRIETGRIKGRSLIN